MMEERRNLNAAFAHDLRTPLTVLRGYTDFLEEYIPSPEKTEEKLLATNRMMSRYIKRLEEYTAAMSTIQKLEDTPLKIQAVPMAEFLDMLTYHMKLAANHSKRFSINDETGLTELRGDTALILRALENVTENAFRYARAKVSLRLFLRDDRLFIEVSDDGPGFSANDPSQAMHPFYTSESKDSSHFGMGLAICKILCENHGGALKVDNVPKQGARVQISVKLEK